jgi:hypothetical protein
VVVLAPLPHQPFIPVLAGLRFNILPSHLLMIWIEGEVKPIRIGQAIVMVVVSRSSVARFIMSFEQRFMAYELIGFLMGSVVLRVLRNDLEVAIPGMFGRQQANDHPGDRYHEDEPSKCRGGVYGNLLARTKRMIGQ